MYFESRIHTIKEVTNVLEAATIIHNKSCYSYEALKWKGASGFIFCVADGGLDHPWAEVAVLKHIADDSYSQIESISAGWRNNIEKLSEALKQAEGAYPYKKVRFIIDKPKGDEIAWFTCGCCGADFKGNVKEQLSYDQDAGYGCCNRCASE